MMISPPLDYRVLNELEHKCLYCKRIINEKNRLRHYAMHAKPEHKKIRCHMWCGKLILAKNMETHIKNATRLTRRNHNEWRQDQYQTAVETMQHEREEKERKASLATRKKYYPATVNATYYRGPSRNDMEEDDESDYEDIYDMARN